MEKFDIIIVGGGPAGSSCAWNLSSKGYSIAIVDKQTFPRDKVCAGWVTPAVIESLQIDSKDYALNNVFQPIKSFVTGMIGGKTVKTNYDDTVSYGIRRCEFDHYLLKRSGAKCILGEKIATMDHAENQWIINSNYSAPLLIGAGGHFCPVARHLGAKPGHTESAVSAQEIEFNMTDEQVKNCNAVGETPELYFCRDLKGYGWIFRKDNYLNIGLGRQDNHNLKSHLHQFVQWLKAENRIPESIPDKYHGHAYLLYGENDRPLTSDNTMIIGDAAGLAYAQSGEGIRPAIESGLLAAKTVHQAKGNYSESSLNYYVDQLEARMGERTNKNPVPIGSSVFRQWLPKIAELALGNGWFSKHIVIDKWFLHKNLPTLQIS